MVVDEKTISHCLDNGTQKNLTQLSLKQMSDIIKLRIAKKKQEIAKKEELIQHVYSFDRCRQIAESEF